MFAKINKEDSCEIYALLGDYENFIKNYDPINNENIDYRFQIFRNVVYGIYHNYDFAKKLYEKNKNIIKIYPLLNIICCRFILSAHFDDYLIKNHPPHCLTYPEILKDEIFEILFKKYKKELEAQLSIICIIKNKTEEYTELDPEPDSLIYSFAEEYKRERCIKQQINKNKKFKNKNIEYNIDGENYYKDSEKPNIMKTIYYLEYLNEKCSYESRITGSNDYETLSDCFGYQDDYMGKLGLNTINKYYLYYIVNKYANKQEFNVLIKNNEIYDNILQVFQIYKNMEKYNDMLCKLAISKLIIMHIDVDVEIIKKYKPFDFTIENTCNYQILIDKYPDIRNELLKGKNKFEKITNKNLS